MAVELTLPTISPQSMTLESVGPITLVLGSVISIAPTITTRPTISGTAKVGERLTATAGDTTGTPPPTSTFQWQRSDNGVSGWSDISGATGTTYVLVSADESKYLRVEQTATNIAGSVTSTSASTSQVAAAFTGLLDTYSGAAAAYSLRLLRGDYEGSAIRVRRSDDNAEQDIGFRNNVLDTSTLESFSLGSDCFVVTWYDQSDNEEANNAAQTTASAQPKIVSSGTTITEGGKPTIDLSSSTYFDLELASGYNLFSVISLADKQFVYSKSTDSNMYIRQRTFGGVDKYRFRKTTSDYTFLGGHIINTRFLFNHNISNNFVQQNGTQNTGTPSTPTEMSFDRLFANSSSANNVTGVVQEFIVWDNGNNNEGIETNINDFYSIF